MPEPLGRDPLLLDYDVLSSGRPEDMKWSEWAAMRSHTRQGIQALLAEVERLRAIAAPLERLETWRMPEDRTFELWEAEDDDGNTMISLQLYDIDKDAAGYGATFHTAITAALDAWDAKYGKDGA